MNYDMNLLYSGDNDVVEEYFSDKNASQSCVKIKNTLLDVKNALAQTSGGNYANI